MDIDWRHQLLHTRGFQTPLRLVAGSPDAKVKICSVLVQILRWTIVNYGVSPQNCVMALSELVYWRPD